MFVSCKVNGSQVNALVDTSASVSILHENFFSRIKRKNTELRRTEQTILGANNDPLELCGIAEVEIELGKTRVQQEVRVCKNLSQLILLGVDFFKPHGCIVDFAAENIELYGEKRPLTCRPSQVVNRITVAESCVTPPRSMINVSCNVDGGTINNDMVGVLEPEERFEERHDTGIIKVVATISNGRISVRMFNPSDSAKRIYRGSNV